MYLKSIFSKIKDRCYNLNNNDYSDYGGRGITVQKSWLETENNFITDIMNSIGHRPTAKHQLNRINNDGNYEVLNVEWATQKENARNKRNNIVVKFNNEEKTLSEWAEITNLSYDLLRLRLKRGVIGEKLFEPKKIVNVKKFDSTNLYNIWYHILERTLDEKCQIYCNYGLRGIKICDRWKDVYSVFKQDIINEIGERPSKIHQLDRINNNGNYEPGNLRWSIPSDNCKNKQYNVSIIINGENKLIIDLAKEYNLPYIVLWKRFKKGFSVEKLLAPILKRKFKEEDAEIIRNKKMNGCTIKKLVNEYKVNASLILDVIHCRGAYSKGDDQL